MHAADNPLQVWKPGTVPGITRVPPTSNWREVQSCSVRLAAFHSFNFCRGAALERTHAMPGVGYSHEAAQELPPTTVTTQRVLVTQSAA